MVFSIGAGIFSWLLFQTRLVPRWISLWGLVGAVLYGVVPWLAFFSVDWGILMAPLALQEMVLAVWLIARGFNS